MAGCYHDKQVFKSNLNIEVAREGDILQEGQDLDEIECDKNPGHRGFIPFKDLTLEHLPNEIRSREILNNIKEKGIRVVRLVVDKIKDGKRIREAGSGCVIKLNNEYLIKTNNYLVKTDEEVKHCTVEFHYDDDSRSGVLTSSGVELVETCPYRDVTFFTFRPLPDFVYQLDWTDDKQPDIVLMSKNNQIEKTRVFVGSDSSKCCGLAFLDLNSSVIQIMFLLWQDGSISYFKSSYFKFQPIPSNIQELTSIEIHIDEEDGNSRVIPGDVVKCGDEFVVEISESIFQDEVKKCRLAWNGEVISRGTRLYFKHVKTEEMFRGVDLEQRLEQGWDNIWTFECHPIPRGLECLYGKCSNNLCCIGHPHGGIKMVTFGRWLGESLERFDDQYRNINQPGANCKCKEVGVRKYSCKTCPGSSGSIVFNLNQKMDLGSNYSHFMGEKVEEFLPDCELIENINMAWAPKGLSQI